MKKAFSLVEVIICIVILSFVMVSLLKINNNNIFLVDKSNNSAKQSDYVILSIDFDDYSKNENEKIFLDKNTDFDHEEIRKELKQIKIDVENKKLNNIFIDIDDFNLELKTYVRNYEINNNIKKKIYLIGINF